MVVVLVSGASADEKAEKIDAKKLVGKWERKDPPKGQGEVMEFTKDGKLIVTSEKKGETIEATYKIEGDKLTLIFVFDKKEFKDECVVSKLTDTDLIYTREGSKTPRPYTRVK
jgi:uncharacterized protein (TIGR03066 family)